MLNTCVPLVVLGLTETGTSSTMSETALVSLDHAQHSSQKTTEITEHFNMVKRMETYGDHHNSDSLQQNTSSPHASQGKSRLQSFPAQNASQNLFIEGFKDCASEVIRFLTEVEQVEDNNPLVMGLQSHLATVSKAFCHESITDLDKLDEADIKRQKTEESQCLSRTNINKGETYSNSSEGLCVPCLISPIVSRSVNTSVSDSSTIDSDISMSISNTDSSHLSVSSDNNPSLLNSSLEAADESAVDFNKADEVFVSQQPSSEHHQEHLISTHLPVASSENNVLSLCHPTQIAVTHNLNQCRNTSEMLIHHMPETSQEVVDSSHANINTINTGVSTFSSCPVQCNPPLDHSSPLPAVSSSSSSNMFSLLGHCHTFQPHPITSASESSNLPQVSVTPTIYTPETINSLQPATQTVLSSCHALSSQLPTGHQTSENNILSGSFPSGLFNAVTEPVNSGDFSQQVSSVLELKANLLPGIDTSSMASGNFADILLAVESCKFHEDPRVRSLADELIHLIHNDDFEDDEDDDDIDDEDDEAEQENEDIHRENGDESGIEMMDESTDWGNPVDMIEQ